MVKSVETHPHYTVTDDGIVTNTRTGKVLKACDNNRGYPTVNLYDDGVRTTKLVHRLVAETFVDGYKEGLTVNHKDGDKHNNSKDNLEWVTYSDNEYHAHRTGLKHGPNQRPVRVIESGEVFESIKACARALGGDDRHIGECLAGRQRTHLGLTFEEADENDVNMTRSSISKSYEFIDKKTFKRPIRITETGEVYPSIRECARSINGDQGTISGCLSGKHKTHKGYHYEYVE